MLTSLQGSPGNLQDFEEMLFATSDIVVAPVVMAIRIANNTAGDKVRPPPRQARSLPLR